MSAQTSIQPFDWVKQLPHALYELDDKPLFGNGPPFPWDDFSAALAKLFGTQDFKLKPEAMQWRTEDKLLEGLGSNLAPIYVTFSDLEGTLCWVMSKNDIGALMPKLLNVQMKAFASIDESYEVGFYRFVISQALQTLKQIEFDKSLNPSVQENKEPLKEAAFCIDVSITAQQQVSKGRLIIPQNLRLSWKEKFAERKQGLPFNSILAQKAQAVVHIEIGKTTLTPKEWSDVSTGDFIVLDTCTYEPDTDKGRVMMTVGGIPMFRAKLKQGNIKILEFPLYHEEDSPMSEENSKDEEFEDLHEESELEEHEEEFDEESGEEHEEAPEHPPEATEKTPGAKTAGAVVEGKKGGVNVNEIPLNIVVEVGRVKMSVQKLMELQPGNMLELDLRPENGVDLVVNGRRIAKGELLRIGDALGVRVLDIG